MCVEIVPLTAVKQKAVNQKAVKIFDILFARSSDIQHVSHGGEISLRCVGILVGSLSACISYFPVAIIPITSVFALSWHPEILI